MSDRVVVETEVRKARELVERMEIQFPLDDLRVEVAVAQQRAIEAIFGYMAERPLFGGRKDGARAV